MNIEGLDYNTQREKLVMPEYGREIQKMVDLAVSLEDKDERQKCAETIICLMESKNPQLLDSENYEQALWDHLYLMSHKQLDIDWPYDVSEAERISSKPAPMEHPTGGAHMRHYGRLIEQLFEELKTMPEGSERDELVRLTANQMKRNLATWGHGTIDDEKVADDLARFTDGKIQIDLSSFRFDSLQGAVPNEGKKGKHRK